MTKNVAQNVTNSNMKDLTELYHKGKLPKGYYYLKKPDGEVMIITPSLRFMVDGYSILAEVPSYEEWFNQGDYVAFLEEEITKLKELLKEWLLFEKEENPHDFTIMSERMEELAKQSKELLGEE